jgi:hypothetical protein
LFDFFPQSLELEKASHQAKSFLARFFGRKVGGWRAGFYSLLKISRAKKFQTTAVQRGFLKEKMQCPDEKRSFEESFFFGVKKFKSPKLGGGRKKLFASFLQKEEF